MNPSERDEEIRPFVRHINKSVQNLYATTGCMSLLGSVLGTLLFSWLYLRPAFQSTKNLFPRAMIILSVFFLLIAILLIVMLIMRKWIYSRRKTFGEEVRAFSIANKMPPGELVRFAERNSPLFNFFISLVSHELGEELSEQNGSVEVDGSPGPGVFDGDLGADKIDDE